MSQSSRKHPSALSFLALSVAASSGGVYAQEFNTAFLQGTTDIPSALKDGVKYPAGEYYVDVSLNGERTTRMALTVSPDDEKNGQLCLSPEWLQNAGIYFQKDAYQKTFDSVRGCYALGRMPQTQVSLNMATQTLDISIPQAWQPSRGDASRWDYGIPGLRMTYNGNFNRNVQNNNNDGYGYNNDTLNAYGNVNASLNIGRWILSSDMNASRNAWGNEFTSNSLSLSTAVSQIQGDLLLGRSQTRTELFSDFGFYGAAIRSNSNMRSWETRGYAPVITGVASSTSRITVSQNGYTIYSRVVPPGPWRLDDINSTSNGTLTVTVEDSGGKKTVTEYPVATLPTLLRPGDYRYNVAAGQRNDSDKLSDAFSSGGGTFGLVSYDYGFPGYTLNFASIVHNRYQAGGAGITLPLGAWGAVSGSINGSRAEYDDNTRRQGVSTSVKYAKSFTSRTDLQLLTYRYQSPGYTEFASWRPEYSDVTLYGRPKARYEARLSTNLDWGYLSASYWQQSYWNKGGGGQGATLSLSTTAFRDVSVFLNANYSRSKYYTGYFTGYGSSSGNYNSTSFRQDNWSMSMGVSIPFDFGSIRHYSTSSVNYDQAAGTSLNESVSAQVNQRLNYNLNGGMDADGYGSASAAMSYAFDRMQTNLAVAQNRQSTTLSGNMAGSLLATVPTGVLLTREASDTVAVLKIKDTPGVTFGSSLPTRGDGTTVMYLSSYTPNVITINPENVPDSAELLNTSFNVVPTEKAIIYREFGYQKIMRYILRVKDAQGKVLTGGSAVTEQGLDAGFIATNGVLLMNLLSPPQTIKVSLLDGRTCQFKAGGLKPAENSVQEVRCE
ncbi:PefC/AfrB family outer membrane usher protein [Citrobacter braakii]|uniref:PefC/AfrB family outer membrane usher protein n=1 Tax=Citrobacter braakii TaxID=57706 RepID=UPI0030806344